MRTVAALQTEKRLPQLSFAVNIIYPVAAVFLWLLLAASTMCAAARAIAALSPLLSCAWRPTRRYCITFGLEAQALVHRYWECLGVQAGGKDRVGDGAEWAAFSDDVRTLAWVCASADVSAVMGLFAACSLIGWRRVARASVLAFSGMNALAGVCLALLGVMLRIDEVVDQPVDTVAIVLGLMVLTTSVLGFVAAQNELLHLLQLYAVLLSVCTTLMCILGIVVFVDGEEVIGGWIKGLGGSPSDSIGAIHVEELIGSFQAHRLVASATAVLVLFFLVLNVSMVLSLRWMLEDQPSADDLVGLMGAESDGEDEDAGEDTDDDTMSDDAHEMDFEGSESRFWLTRSV